jgi:UDP-N-acetylmuramoyl-L-alanyl-D-glutamate--2,6-diaminopimelate ligase
MGQPFTVIVDFAHTPIRFNALLVALRDREHGRIIVVFGSSGIADHDSQGVGYAVSRGADFFVITSEDPGQRDPADIARRVASGAIGRTCGVDYEIVLDRRDAIRRAMALARSGDIVVLAGKGTERTMVFAHGDEPWNERLEAEEAIRELWW